MEYTDTTTKETIGHFDVYSCTVGRFVAICLSGEPEPLVTYCADGQPAGAWEAFCKVINAQLHIDVSHVAV